MYLLLDYILVPLWRPLGSCIVSRIHFRRVIILRSCQVLPREANLVREGRGFESFSRDDVVDFHLEHAKDVEMFESQGCTYISKLLVPKYFDWHNIVERDWGRSEKQGRLGYPTLQSAISLIRTNPRHRRS